jgi:hypothetical protein
MKLLTESFFRTEDRPSAVISSKQPPANEHSRPVGPVAAPSVFVKYSVVSSD